MKNITFVAKLVDQDTRSVNRTKFTVRGTALLHKKRKWESASSARSVDFKEFDNCRTIYGTT